jgi:hypothetical protein
LQSFSTKPKGKVRSTTNNRKKGLALPSRSVCS